MSNVTRGLFDPRQKFQTWPEPNDDPNIPYVWGLNGYQVGKPESPSEQDQKIEKAIESKTMTTQTAQYILGASLVLGVVGVFRGYQKSNQVETSQKVFDAVASGFIYATGVGAVIEEMRDK